MGAGLKLLNGYYMRALILNSIMLACFAGLFSTKGFSQSVYSTASQKGKLLTLKYASDHINREISEAEICGDQLDKLAQAKLWMPQHGHGSGETSIVQGGSGCVLITDIDFVMAGRWDIQLFFSDGDRAVFSFLVQP